MKETSRLSKKVSKTNLQRISRMYSKEKGITLIALVITVVILIILATVTLNVVLGEGGLIQRAQQAKDLTEQAALEEQQGLNSLMSEYANIMAEDQNPPVEKSEVEEAKESGKRFEDTTTITDADEEEITIPGEFHIAEDSGTKVEDGVVIEDDSGNQFVWIPVNDYTTMYQEAAGTKLTGVETTTNIYSKLRKNNVYVEETPNSIGLREPDLVSDYDMDEQYYKDILGYNNPTEMAEGFVEEYEATYNSIKRYKGFYIGRYELTGSLQNPTVQKNQTVLTRQNNWYNLRKACSNLVSSKYAQSTMMYGNQWDEIMSWLIATGDKTDYQINTNSSDWGNYYDSTGTAATDSGKLQTSGKNEAWKANNIYDLAGNCMEFTQEAYNTYGRAPRGGLFSGSAIGNPASYRSYYDPNIAVGSYSTRPALYIK